MAYEIEMKAWVDDWQALERYLRDRCVARRSFRKEDRYFVHADGDRLFRVRVDGHAAYVTYKEKDVRDGMEVNLEREFGVDDAGAFIDLIVRLGCREEFTKVKTGLHFDEDGLTVELVHVEELGDFLEVELVLEESGDDAHRAAGERIRRFISEAGVPADAIEARPYMQLLRESGERRTPGSGR